jgi:hypothetical protein
MKGKKAAINGLKIGVGAAPWRTEKKFDSA